ncbi:MAG: redox-sensing transcriptional repressor Rex [Chloroflexi bacterium]|nr:redox-sensing transcriptional repressor Rex [Chloroflexota bacterium]
MPGSTSSHELDLMSEEIPDIVIGRLPIYLRALNQMAQMGREVTSSRELGEFLGISSAQIRKDLSHFGGFGKQGTGYHVETLRNKLQQILHVDREWPVAIVGAGYLGHALAHYRGFTPRGFRVVAVFDIDPDKIGQKIDGMNVMAVERIAVEIPSHSIQIAMLAVPVEVAQSLANDLIKAGIRGILNYAPINLAVPDGVHVQYIDPVVELQHMTFYLGG